MGLRIYISSNNGNKEVSLSIYSLYIYLSMDQAERHDIWPRLWLFFSPFLSPSKKEGRRKGEWIARIIIKSHAFLLDHICVSFSMYICLSINSNNGNKKVSLLMYRIHTFIHLSICFIFYWSYSYSSNIYMCLWSSI